MAKIKHIIIFLGKDAQLAQTITNQYLHKRAGVFFVKEDMVASITDNSNRMFGLLFGPEHYADRAEVILPDFYGETQASVVAAFRELMERFGGPGVYGKITGRRIRFDTLHNVFCFVSSPNNASLIALVREQSLTPEVSLICYIDHPCDLQQHERAQLKGATIKEISNIDPEIFAIGIKEIVRKFVGLEE